MHMRKIVAAAAALTLAMAVLTGCSSSGEKEVKKVEGLDKLGKITVVAREEGSGTRQVFADLAGFSNENADTDAKDQTTEDAVIKKDASEVISEVEEDTSAIGYISTGAASNLGNAKIVCLDGVSPDSKNIQNGKYAMSRTFYLAYKGELSDSEQDFLTYIKGKGQEIVEKSYTPIAKGSSFLSSQAKGTITIHGSTSAAPLVEELAAEYMKINPNTTIEVEATDSTQGLNDALNEKCDFGMSSRELKDYEKELLDYEPIAKDAIAIIVNKENPLEDISVSALKKIYTGELGTWNDLNMESKGEK